MPHAASLKYLEGQIEGELSLEAGDTRALLVSLGLLLGRGSAVASLMCIVQGITLCGTGIGRCSRSCSI